MNISDKYSDTDIVCKYGFTDDLDRRLKEHQTNFNKIENVDIKLKYYTYIDHNELSKAESRLKNMFKLMDNFIEYQDYKEIVIISQDNYIRP
jgi:predicted GIY-YIG superfamily endonuclease